MGSKSQIARKPGRCEERPSRVAFGASRCHSPCRRIAVSPFAFGFHARKWRFRRGALEYSASPEMHPAPAGLKDAHNGVTNFPTDASEVLGAELFALPPPELIYLVTALTAEGS
jgi:hypothetical protein